MTFRGRRFAATAGAAAALAVAGLTVEMPAASYFHAPAGGPPAYTTWSTGRSLFGSGRGHGYSPYSAPSTWGTPAIAPYGASPYSAMPYGASYSNPRGRISYDVQTPYGTMEHHYRYRRNGTVSLDIDD